MEYKPADGKSKTSFSSRLLAILMELPRTELIVDIFGMGREINQGVINGRIYGVLDTERQRCALPPAPQRHRPETSLIMANIDQISASGQRWLRQKSGEEDIFPSDISFEYTTRRI